VNALLSNLAVSAEMPVLYKLKGGLTSRGHLRGCYEWPVRGFNHLTTHDAAASSIFELGGFKWKLGLLRDCPDSYPQEMIRVFLFSCNNVRVNADVKFTVSWRSRQRYRAERRNRIAFPFSDIDKRDIPIDKRTVSNRRFCDEPVITVDLKNISPAKEKEEQRLVSHMRTVSLEVFSKETINERLNGCAAFGLLSPYQESTLQVCGDSLVLLWTGQSSDYRYWLCKRTSGLGVIVERCLNDTELLECFGNIQDEDVGPFSAITLFKEKKGDTPFVTITDQTTLLFCKIYEPENGSDLTYGGHLYVDKTMPCHDLYGAIVNNIRISDPGPYDLYLEVGNLCIKDITSEHRSLEKCEVHPGSCIIVKRRKQDQAASVDLVQEALRQYHNGDDASAIADNDSTASGLQLHIHRRIASGEFSLTAHADAQTYSRRASSPASSTGSKEDERATLHLGSVVRQLVGIGFLVLSLRLLSESGLASDVDMLSKLRQQLSNKVRALILGIPRSLIRFRWKHFLKTLASWQLDLGKTSAHCTNRLSENSRRRSLR